MKFDIAGLLRAPDPRAPSWPDPRRERIATAALTGLLASPHVDPLRDKVERYAVEYADALIAELDKEVKP